jgi:hypothetical protein
MREARSRRLEDLLPGRRLHRRQVRLRPPVGLECSLIRPHIDAMEHIDKCTSLLRDLIANGQTSGIPLAEKAIDELLAATPASQKKESLSSVQSAVLADRDAVARQADFGSELGFVDTVNDYIEKLMRSLE